MTIKPSKPILLGMIAATASFALSASSSAQNNGISDFPITIDGAFTNTLEWSDVTPAHFFSAPGTTASPVPLNDPTANSALYAAIGRRTPAQPLSLHLLYDFVPRTNPFVLGGEVVAAITFPLHLPVAFHPPGTPQGADIEQNVSVIFQGGQRDLAAFAAGAIGGFFDVFVDFLDGRPLVPAEDVGLFGAAGFGPSPLSSNDHLIVELGVGLRIPQNFGVEGPLNPGGAGINPATGLYDPDPAFWGAAAGGGGLAGDTGGGANNLQSASAALFRINPDGSTTVTPVPEPTSAALLLASLGLAAARRRR